MGDRHLLTRLRRELAGWRERRRGGEAVRLDRVDRDISHVWELLDGHEQRIARTERLVRVATVMAWIEHARLAREPLVSVVMATRDRASVLSRAVASVREQSYQNWELLVCEDGSSDDTASVVASFDEPRLRYLPAEPAGVGATRNRGVDNANGELVAYLDDDNRMHPNWLKSVAWAFEQRPGEDVLYGAIVIDDTARLHREPGEEMPSAWLERYDPETILDSNVADTSAIAHRAGVQSARWDEGLKTMADWDFILRVSADREPLALPAIACFYYTDAGGRLSDLDRQHDLDRRLITVRARDARQAL